MIPTTTTPRRRTPRAAVGEAILAFGADGSSFTSIDFAKRVNAAGSSPSRVTHCVIRRTPFVLARYPNIVAFPFALTSS
jgi:hypothetical protein